MLSSFPQNSVYDANDLAAEATFAAVNKLPWHLRGPSDGRAAWKQQKRRPDGTYRNSGGFKKKAGKIYSASGKQYYFSLTNPNGCIYACTLQIVVVRLRYFGITRER